MVAASSHPFRSAASSAEPSSVQRGRRDAKFSPGASPDTSQRRALIKAGRITAFAELVPPCSGISPADPRLDRYSALAEAFDLPVGIDWP
jgi:hypothetical protein